jgi:hypothetical protein
MKVVTIGRSSSCNVVIDDPTVSLNHCQIIQGDNGDFIIVDTNSTNGTMINGQKRYGQVRLNPNDIVKIGNTVLPWQAYFFGSNNHDPKDGGGFTPPMTKPDNFMVWAILSTIFCCVPFGICSIVYAAKVDSLWYSGNYDEARKAARTARTWFWWSFGLGLFFGVIYLVYYFLLGVAIGMGY